MSISGEKTGMADSNGKTLFDKLAEYTSGDVYPMHMPGHKRNGDFLRGLTAGLDISEIDGFDDLHRPRDVLRETSGLAARVYGSGRAFLLVNGSTAGVLAAIGGLTNRGDKALMARNCHMSVYNAIALFGLRPVYIMPQTDPSTGITRDVPPRAVEDALRNDRDIKLVVLTSPTYEGVVSDVTAIAEIAHTRGVPLFVDSAHGAHFGFSQGFPVGAVAAGADVTVMSLHKTLPALTQCSLLHVGGDIADADEIKRLLSVFQTSSPSYVLMASIDKCLRILDSDGDSLFREYERNLLSFYNAAAPMRNLRLLWNPANDPVAGFFAFDQGKLVIDTGKTTLTGNGLMDLVREKYNVELEMAGVRHALAMTSLCDTPEGFRRLADALLEIDGVVAARDGSFAGLPADLPMPDISAMPSEALKLKGRHIPLEDSAGFMSLEYVCARPPGVPIIVPGEIMGDETISYIAEMRRRGICLDSTTGKLPKFIYAL